MTNLLRVIGVAALSCALFAGCKKTEKPAMGSEQPEAETYTERLLKAKKKAWEDKNK